LRLTGEQPGIARLIVQGPAQIAARPSDKRGLVELQGCGRVIVARDKRQRGTMECRRPAAMIVPGIRGGLCFACIGFDEREALRIALRCRIRGQSRAERNCATDQEWNGGTHRSKKPAGRRESKTMEKNLFCFGLGYTACALARRLRSQGWRVGGTTRTAGSARRLATFEAIVFDGTQSQLEIARGGAVLISVPPDADGDPVLRSASETIRAAAPSWLGYLSTTGVYGDRNGAWVDETTPPEPTSARARHRLAAERSWLEFAAEAKLPLQVFRLAGIYGPGRSAFDALRAGVARRFDKPGQIFSRIHVDDITAVLEASLDRSFDCDIYNVCDDEPAPQADVIAYAARLSNLEPPPLEPFEAAEASLSEMARSFYRDSKRVRNDKMKEKLGVVLKYPTYREGLTAILHAE